MTQPKLFGTDGIRGEANQPPMDAATALAIGQAAGQVFMRGDHRHLAVVGKDTRLSGYLIEPALTAGFIAAGMDVALIGPIPTPAVAMLTKSLRADLGVMISASHNPYQDNGIKFFGPDGYKLSDAVEAQIEALVFRSGGGLAAPHQLGRARRLEYAQGRYIEFAKSTFPRHRSLEGLKIVLDCAHGAAYHVAPLILRELGAEVITIGVSPDGLNINQDCGSTAPAALCARVVQESAHIGIALDGDADRVILCDELGRLIDGDQLMAMLALSWQRSGRLTGGGIVATHMSNMGLERFLAVHNLSLIRTQIGDRHVIERMRQDGYNLGGEQSGHMILSDYATTGDGLIAALQAIVYMLEAAEPFSQCSRLFTPWPQLLKNIRFTGPSPLHHAASQTAIAEAEAAFSGKGRLLVRPSGTEKLIRVMAEGEDAAQVEHIATRLADALSRIAV